MGKCVQGRIKMKIWVGRSLEKKRTNAQRSVTEDDLFYQAISAANLWGYKSLSCQYLCKDDFYRVTVALRIMIEQHDLLVGISVHSFLSHFGINGLLCDVQHAVCSYHADQTLVSISSEDLLLQFSDASLQSVQCGSCRILCDSVERKTQKAYGQSNCYTKHKL